MFEDEKIAKVVSLIKDSAKPARTPRAKPGNTININGDGTSAGQIAGGDIHNHTYTKAPRGPRVTVTPGAGVISDEEKVALTTLRDEWITLHNAIKKRPLGYGAAWKRINDAAGATSYHLIKSENYDLAVDFVRKQMALLRNMASAPAKDKKWRASRISAIKLRSKNQLGDPDAYKAYIRKNFGAESLADLATDQLQRTYAYIMAKKAVERPS